MKRRSLMLIFIQSILFILSCSFYAVQDEKEPLDIINYSMTEGDGFIEIRWNYSSQENLEGVQISYGIGNAESNYMIVKNTDFCIISGLTNGYEYTFLIQTFTKNKMLSSGVYLTGVPNIPPWEAEVTELSYQARDQSVLLSWNNPSDTEFDHVEILYGITNTDTVFTGTIDSSQTLIDGLDNNENYNFLIRTIDKTGRISAGISFFLQPDPAPIITLNEPQSFFYNSLLPTSVNFDLSETCPQVEVSLNGTVLPSGSDLSGSVLGLNTVTVTAVDVAGNRTTQDVVYFYNNLALADSDDFNRTDNPMIGIPPWDNEVDDDKIMNIAGQEISCTGSYNTNAFGLVDRYYDGLYQTQNIQKIEITKMSDITEGAVFLVFLDYESDQLHQVQAFVQTVMDNGVFAGYKISLAYYNYNYTRGTSSYKLLGESDLFDYNFTYPLTFLFFRNNDNYQAVVLDNVNGDFLASVQIPYYSYPDIDGKSFNRRGIQLMPFDSTGITGSLISADNYEFY